MLELSPEQIDLVRAILRRHVPGFRVVAYGSRVQGRARPSSDLDLAIIAPQAIPLGTLGLLQDDFAESDLPFRVDVVDRGSLAPDFQTLIGQHGIEIDFNTAPALPGKSSSAAARL